MLARLSPKPVGAVATALALILLSACKHTQVSPPPPQTTYSKTYDKEIKDIMDSARQDRWEEAQAKANALYQRDPKNPMVDRVHSWVIQTGQKRREEALENKIRDIDAKTSVFNPTPQSLLSERKDRGLPATKDVRDTVHRIENSPYIPD
jgi:hypothetical protein